MTIFKEALFQAKLAKAIYSRTLSGDFSFPQIYEVFRSTGFFPLCSYFYDYKGCEALIAVYAGRLQVVFCGTNERLDWDYNLKFIKKDFDGLGRVHRGALEALKNVLSATPAFINGSKNVDSAEVLSFSSILRHHKDLPIYVSGHSLGGMIAVLFSIWGKRNGLNVARLYTFGQPRVLGVKAAAKTKNLLPEKFYRFQNNNDPFPLYLPPNLLLYKFSDAGKSYYIDSKGKIICEPNVAVRFGKTFLGVVDYLIDPDKKYFYSDHEMEPIIVALEQAIA